MNKLVEKQRVHFNSISEKYFRARSNPNHLLLKKLIWEKFLARNAFLSDEVARVLEPMCGMAEGHEILSENLKKSFDYYGFDYSEKMVEIAREYKPNLRVEWDDVTKYQPEERSFDLVVLIGGLHHVYTQTEEVLMNLRKCLRPGGYFLSFEPTHNNPIARNVRQRIYEKNELFDDETEQGFEYCDLEQYFKNAGFEKVDEVFPGLLAYILYYNPDAFPALNVGGSLLLRSIFNFERLFWGNWVGRKLSFATISLWKLK